MSEKSISSRTSKMALNSLSAGLLAIITMVAGFLIPRYIIEYYGSEVNGLTVAIRQFVNYLNYIELGVYPMFFTALFVPLAKRDKNKISGIVSEARKTYFQISLIYLIVLIVAIFVYPLVINRGDISYSKVLLVTLIFGLGGLLNIFALSRYKVLFAADQKISIINIFDIFQTIAIAAIQLILIRLQFDILIVLSVPIPLALLKVFYLHIIQKKKYSFIDYKTAEKVQINIRRRDTFLFEIVLSLGKSLPIFVLSIVATLNDVNIFSVYNLIFIGLGTIVTMFTGGTTASFGNLIAEQNETNTRKVYKDFFVLLNIINVILFGTTLFLSIPFVKIYLRTTDVDIQTYINVTFVLLFVGYYYVSNMRIPALNIIRAAGKYREANLYNVVSFLIQVVATFTFTYYFGIIGALSSMLVLTLVKLFLFMVIAERHIVKKTIKFSLINIILGATIMFAFYFIIDNVFEIVVTNVLQFVLFGFLFVLIYAFLIVTSNLILNKKEMLSLWKRAIRLLKFKKSKKVSKQ